MGTRKNPKPKKSNKRFRKTRSKRQRGGEDTPTIEEQGLCGDCSICLKPMDNVNVLIATDCKHTFHKDCLRRWCQNQANTKCPLCRGDISNTCTDLSSTNILPRAATATSGANGEDILRRYGAEDAERRRMIATEYENHRTQRRNRALIEREREREMIAAHAHERLVAAAAAADAYDSDAADPDNNTRVQDNNTRVPDNNNTRNIRSSNQRRGDAGRRGGPSNQRRGGKKRTKKTKRRSRK